MNPKSLSDQSLLLNVETAAQKERVVLAEIVTLFHEIERRKLYAVTHSSMFEFGTKKLLMSEGQAQRRIDASRILGELPEIAEKLVTGRLNLSHTTLAQKYFRHERKQGRVPSRDERLKLVSELEGKSARDAEKLIAKRTGLEKLRAIRIMPKADERELLERVRALWAHRFPDGDWTQIVVAMAKLTLERIDPLAKAERAAARKAKVTANAARAGGETEGDVLESGDVQYRLPAENRSRYVGAEVKHEAWLIAGGRCEYVAPDGTRCSSTRALELEHRVPFALGGGHTAENIQILCQTHNSLRAREVYGRKWMARKVTAARAKSAAKTVS